MMLRRIILVGCLLVACAPALYAASAEETVVLESLKASYQGSLKAIVDAQVPPELLKQYGDSIDAVTALCQKNGDLEGLVAAKKEKKRFEQEKTVPEESAGDLAPAMVKARQDYRRAVTRSELDRNRKILALSDKYTASLETLKKQLTQQGKIEEAMAAKEESDRVRSSAEVTAAQFALADEASTRPPPVAAVKPTVEPRVDTPKAKSLTARGLNIPCKGGMDSDWTKTSLEVKRGDAVTIKAKGVWRCSKKDRGCGPEGYDDVSEQTVWEYDRATHTSTRREITFNSRTKTERYGTLLCKVGAKGVVRAVGNSLGFTASEEGFLFLDTNVEPGKEQRKGCSGDLNVDIEVKRQ